MQQLAPFELFLMAFLMSTFALYLGYVARLIIIVLFDKD